MSPKPPSSKKHRGQHSDPSASAPNPLVGSFTPTPRSSRSRSLSPQKRFGKQPLQIRMNLTENQMDRITDAVTYKINSSPARSRSKTTNSSQKLTPRREQASPVWRQPRYSLDSSSDLESRTFSQLMPGKNCETGSPNLAERRRKMPIPPIHVGSPRAVTSRPQRPAREAISDLVSPLHPAFHSTNTSTTDDVSEYSSEYFQASQPEPLKLQAVRYEDDQSRAVVDDEFLAGENWMTAIPSQSPVRDNTFDHGSHSRSHSQGPQGHNGCSPSRRPQQLAVPADAGAFPVESPLFSPLALYFRGPDFPTAKKGEKTMIGDNGWLERTGKGIDKKSTQKKTGILNSIKKIAKDVSELHHPSFRSQPASKTCPGAAMTISLNAREQSLLYCELEFHLTDGLNAFITSELDRGRLTADKLKRISDAWLQRGRPRVVAFRYDLETQLDLLDLHTAEFAFHGRRQGNPSEVTGLLHAMRVNARALRIRTFCQPDSVIAKQLVDAQSLFNLIGTTETRHRALAEVAQFFKVIVEREQHLGRADGQKRYTQEFNKDA